MAEMRRSVARPRTDLNAYDLYLRALAVIYPPTRERTVEALGLLDRAVAIDRDYGPALASAAFCHMVLDLNGWAEEPEATRRKASDLARRALQAAQNDPRILANAASALAYFGEDISAMMALADRALAINPSYVRGWYLSGVVRLWAGQPDLVIEHIETALRLSPREPLGLPLHVRGMAYFFNRRFEKAAAQLLLSIQEHRGYAGSYRGLAACYAQLGRFD